MSRVLIAGDSSFSKFSAN